MAEKVEKTERKQSEAEEDSSKEIENDFEVIKETPDDKYDLRHNSDQHMSLPVQSMTQVAYPKAPSTAEIKGNKTDISENQTDCAGEHTVLKGSGDVVKTGLPQYVQAEKKEKVDKTDYAAWRLVDSGDQTLLKTNDGKWFLPPSLSRRNDLTLEINQGKAYIILSKNEFYEVKMDTDGSVIYVRNPITEPGQILKTLNIPDGSKSDEIESDNVNQKTVTEKEADITDAIKEIKANEEFNCNTSLDVKAENQFDINSNAACRTEVDSQSQNSDSVKYEESQETHESSKPVVLAHSKSEAHTNKESVSENEPGVDSLQNKMTGRQSSSEFSFRKEESACGSDRDETLKKTLECKMVSSVSLQTKTSIESKEKVIHLPTKGAEDGQHFTEGTNNDTVLDNAVRSVKMSSDSKLVLKLREDSQVMQTKFPDGITHAEQQLDMDATQMAGSSKEVRKSGASLLHESQNARDFSGSDITSARKEIKPAYIKTEMITHSVGHQPFDKHTNKNEAFSNETLLYPSEEESSIETTKTKKESQGDENDIINSKIDDIAVQMERLKLVQEQKTSKGLSGLNGSSSCTDGIGQPSLKMSLNSCTGTQLAPADETTAWKTEEVPVVPIFQMIIEHARQEKETKHLFWDIEVSFIDKGDKIVCVLKRKCDVSDSVVKEILKLQTQYGTRDVSFNEIKNLSLISDQKQMVNELLGECRKDPEFIYKVDMKKEKILIAAKSQSEADTIIETKLKKGLNIIEKVFIGNTKDKSYMKQFKAEIHRLYGSKIEIEIDYEGLKIKFIGLKAFVKSASEDFLPISKSHKVGSADEFEFIAKQIQNQALTGETNLVLIEMTEGKGFVLHGPSYQVGKLSDMICAMLNEFYANNVDITDFETMSYLNSNAGKEFVEDLVTKHKVSIERDGHDELLSSGVGWQKTHTFPGGNVVILANQVHRNHKDVLEVKLQVSDYPEGHRYCKTEEGHFIVCVPKYNEGLSKEKEKFNVAMKLLLEFVQRETITQLSVSLEEIGGWSFRKLVKQVLVSLKEYMAKALTIPTTVYLSTTDTEKYKEAERIFVEAFPDMDDEPQTSNMEFDETHFETNASKVGLQIDVWKKDLLETEADVLVYAAHPSLDLLEGSISASLAARAGSQLQIELKKNVGGKKLEPWEFVCTEGYNLPYRFVFHGALEPYENRRRRVKDMQNFIYRCLVKAEQLQMKSIVFPALGAGKCKYRLEDIAVAVYEAAMLFEMKNPCPCLTQVTMVAVDDKNHDALSKEIQRKRETNLLRVGKILLRGRLTKIDAVMADSLIVFWEMNALKAVPVQDLSLFWTAGTDVQKIFIRERDRKGVGRTFKTPGGNFYSESIVHVPFYDDESKLESAFQDGIETVEKDGCKSCVLYFPEKSPMLKYKEKMVKHLLKTIETQSEKLASVKFIVVVTDSSDQTFLYWFEQYSKPPVPTGGQIQQKSATKIVKPEVSQAVKITGSKENVKRATEELEDKIALLQKDVKGSSKLPVTPPVEQKIPRSDRRVLDNPHTEGLESELRATGHAAKMAVHHETGKKREPATVHEKTQKGAREDQRKLEQSKDSDIQHAHEWNPSLLVHDEYDCLCIEVGNIEETETYDTLRRKIVNRQFPFLTPHLIYPFENEHKALLICQMDKDADKMDGFKHKDNDYTYKKLNPQCLQMMKVCLPHAYINDRKEKSQFHNLKLKLEEIGVVEMPKSEEDLSVTVTVLTVSQMKVLNDVLKTFEVDVVEKSPSSDNMIPEETVPGGGHLKKTYRRTPSSDFTSHGDSVHGRNPLSNYFSDAQAAPRKSPSSDDYDNVEKISNVSELLWKVLNNVKVNTMNKLKWKSINVIFENDYILIDGHKDKVAIIDIMEDIKQLKQLQMEEIKPTKMAHTDEYVKWCADARSALEKECCVYDEENSRFIAFGESYEDISKVKHQLGLKQGMIKQTGRRRNRNFDAPAPPIMPEIDSGSRSLPSFSRSMSEPKHGSPDFNWSFDAKQKQEYTTDEGIKVCVYIADILKLPVDCIVNAANDTLQHGGGVALVIAKGAGWKLTHEGDDYVRKHGNVPVGKACRTTAGNLPYDCVIHAVGPRWHDFRPYTLQKVKECESLLQNAIISSFTLAEIRNLKTIALPAISSAIFAVPEEMCAVQYAKAVLKYSSGSVTNAQRLEEIHFIDKNPSIIRLIQKTFQVMIADKKETDYDIMNYVTDKSSVSVYKMSTRQPTESLKTSKDLPIFVDNVDRCEILAGNGSKVYLYDGNILEAYKKRVSSIVCSDDDTGRGKGGLANALMSNAKRFSYGTDKYTAFQSKWPKTGEVVFCAGKGTGFQNVFHAILWGFGHTEDQKGVTLTAYKNLLTEIDWRRLDSVAMPLLGTGSFKPISLEDSADAFMSSYIEFCDTKKADSRLVIHLICKEFRDKTKVTEVFKRLLQREEKTPEPARKKSKDDHHDIGDEKEDSKATDETCCICMETVSAPKTLPCGHVFCKGCIDNYLDNYKKACPTCGKVCGIIKGDQPEGKMSVTVKKWNHCAGYESCGTIEIVYDFPSGLQEAEHPTPGKFYTGIRRTAYLPDNKEGQEILALLRIAFDRKLVFTIGHSRTTGKDGVITWNDIHQKTNPHPGGNFGYPDPGYFDRVKDELAVKGVTVEDLPQLSSHPQLSGDRSVRGRRH